MLVKGNITFITIGFHFNVLVPQLGTIAELPSVASRRVHVRKRPVLIGCKHDMFWRQTFEVWSGRLLST